MIVRRTWQSAMIAMARSPGWTQRMQASRSASGLARRYVGGGNVEEALATARSLRSQGLQTSLFFLGEYLDSRELVEENVAAKIEVARRLADADLDVHVSVDPTQIGCSIDEQLGSGNAQRIAQVVREVSQGRPGLHCVMLDMEDFSVNQATLSLHERLLAAGFPVALTLQAYLHKTHGDMKRAIARGAKIRLVKGAFAARPDVAFTGLGEIKDNFRRLLDLMLGREARETGFYPIIATHDENLQAYAIDRARAAGWEQGEYEFEMLYGVRPALAQRLAEAGERVRLYLPFGRDWWPYAVRRIGENPRNALLLARSLVSSG